MGEQNHNADIKLAVAHQQAGRLREAALVCQQVLNREPENAAALSVLGIVHCQLGRKDLGIGFAGRAVQIQPAVASYQYNYGEAWLAVGETDQAIQAFRKAVSLNGDRPEPYAGLGAALHRRGKWPESIAALRKAIELGFCHTDVYVDLAKSLMRCGKLDEAANFVQKALDLKPDLAEAWQVRGEILGHRQQYSEAVTAFSQAARLAPSYARPHHGSGVVLALQGNFPAAAAAMEQALKLEPNYPEANCGMGAILLRAGRGQEAVPFYEKALAGNPYYLEARADLALAYEKVGRLKDAASQYEALARVSDDEAFFRFQRASLGEGEVPAAAPSELVARLFDRYARFFDEHLTKYLGYRAPQLIFQATTRANPGHQMHILDLGCGTGLCGQLFKPLAVSLIGVDLSPAMVQKAQERGIYDRLIVGDLSEVTAKLSERFDLVTACDVFCYIGDLAPIFHKVAQALRPGGFFAFTVEAISNDEPAPEGYRLRQSRRYAHSADYIRALAARVGFEVLSLDQTALRTENQHDMAGLVVVLRCPNATTGGPAVGTT